MNDLKDLVEAIGPLLIVAATLVLYAFAAQLVNDPACASLNSSGSLVYGKGLMKVLMMCW